MTRSAPAGILVFGGALSILPALPGMPAPPGFSAKPAAAQELRPESVYEIDYAHEPRISPDGSTVAYVRRTADRVRDRWQHDLEVVSVRTGATDWVAQAERLVAPRFSPDGGRLAWIAYGDGFWEIAVYTLSTRRTASLALGSRPIGGLVWSPTGERLAFTRLRAEEQGGGVHLFQVSASGGGPRQVSRESFPLAHRGLATRIDWGPEGTALVVANAPRAPDGGTDPDDAEIFEVAADGGYETALVRRPGPDAEPAVSPDGGFVAFVGRNEAGGPGTVHLAERTAGSAARRLAAPSPGDVSLPRWAPDGSGVYALIERGGVSGLAWLALDGSSRIVADSLGSGDSAGSGSADYSVSADSAGWTLAFVRSLPDRPPEVWTLAGRPNERPRRATSMNADLDPSVFGAVEAVEGIESPAGRRIPAWLVNPPAETDGDAPPPLVVYASDGLRPPDGARFDFDKQVIAAAGYAVLYGPSGAASGDLVHALEALVRRGRVDEDRMFVVGPGATTFVAAAADSRLRAAFGWNTPEDESPGHRAARLRATLDWLRAAAGR